jgi:polyphosphate kinase
MTETTRGEKERRRNERGRPNLSHRTYYINRELSWLDFNARVLEEALDPRIPLLERVKFLSIFGSNLDEFFMIRVSGLRRQLAGVVEAPPDGMSPSEQLADVRQRLLPMLQTATGFWRKDLLPGLAAAGIHVLDYEQTRNQQRKLLRRVFRKEVFPVLTPLAFDPAHPFPHISNLSINLAVVVKDAAGERFARLKVPPSIPRLLRIPGEEEAESFERLGLGTTGVCHFVWLEQVIAANLDLLFPGLKVLASHPFRITRDADFEIEGDEAADLLEAMTEVVGQRHFGSAIRLEVDTGMPDRIRNILTTNLGLAPYQVYASEGPLGLADIMEIARLDRREHKDPPWPRSVPHALSSAENIFNVLRARDVVLYHPYDSFDPVVSFIRQAASDPDVLAIKQTLYRSGAQSPIVEALMAARENGKQVSAVIELKARFDEENNITWARALEQAGVHVVFGLLGLKVHAKMCLVVRREMDGIRCYVHLGTGNYNPATARVYADLGYFTTDAAIAADVLDLFNALTGYSEKADYSRVLVSPHNTRDEIIRRIEREIRKHQKEGNGRLAFKLNALVDKACIRALYKASMAGVKVDLQVRGVCCLRPGVPRISDNITVTSVVGRFLEHSRMYWFRNGGQDELLLGSADLMPRNLDGRVEVLFPVLDERLKKVLRDDVLFLHLRDNVKARLLLKDGTYRRIVPPDGGPAIDSQQLLATGHRPWHPETDPAERAAGVRPRE